MSCSAEVIKGLASHPIPALKKPFHFKDLLGTLAIAPESADSRWRHAGFCSPFSQPVRGDTGSSLANIAKLVICSHPRSISALRLLCCIPEMQVYRLAWRPCGKNAFTNPGAFDLRTYVFLCRIPPHAADSAKSPCVGIGANNGCGRIGARILQARSDLSAAGLSLGGRGPKPSAARRLLMEYLPRASRSSRCTSRKSDISVRASDHCPAAVKKLTA